MPSVVSHYLLAERVWQALKIYEPHIRLNHKAFLWGAFGPDIFLVHRVMPWQKGRSYTYLSNKMHNYPAEKLLNYMAAYSKNNHNQLALSYTFGFITHYALDSETHPYVLSLSKKLSEERNHAHISICHNEIESVLDTLYFKKESGKSIGSFRLQKTAPYDKEVSGMITELLHGFFLTSHLGNIPEEEITQAQNDWRRSLLLMNDRHSFKKKIIKMGEKALKLSPMLSPLLRENKPDLSFDYANMSHAIWLDQERLCRQENFFELVDQAEEKSLKLILTILAGKYLSHEECSASFSGY